MRLDQVRALVWSRVRVSPRVRVDVRVRALVWSRVMVRVRARVKWRPRSAP